MIGLRPSRAARSVDERAPASASGDHRPPRQRRPLRCLLLVAATALCFACDAPATAVAPSPPTGPPASAQARLPTAPPSSASPPVPIAAATPLPERLACTDRTGRTWDEPRLAPGTEAVPTPPPAKGNPADRVLASARGEVRACYQVALNNDACTEGRTSFRLHVGADGAVERWCLGAAGTIATSTAVPCIASTLAGLRFPPPENGAATISGSFSFVNANPSASPPASR